MGKAKRLGTGTRNAGLAIEYVRSRKVVRLLGRLHGQSHPAAQGWGELAAIDGQGQVNQLAWFGLHPATDAPPAPRKHPLRRLLPSGAPPAYLRAVTPSSRATRPAAAASPPRWGSGR